MSQKTNTSISVVGIDIHIVGMDDRGAIMLGQKFTVLGRTTC